MGANGADGSNLLVLSPPHLDLQALTANLGHIDLEVTEVALEDTARAGDGNLTGLNIDLDCNTATNKSKDLTEMKMEAEKAIRVVRKEARTALGDGDNLGSIDGLHIFFGFGV